MRLFEQPKQKPKPTDCGIDYKKLLENGEVEVSFTIPKDPSDDNSTEVTRRGVVLFAEDKSEWIEVVTKVDWKTNKIYNIKRQWLS